MVLLSFSSSCSKEKEMSKYVEYVPCNEADDYQNTFSGKIAKILSNNCAVSGCHDAITHEQGLDYTTYSSAVNSFGVIALCSIYQDGSCQPMPRNAPKLSDADIHDLCCWVKSDYPK